MEQIATIGLDIAKSVFQVHGIGKNGSVVVQRRRFDLRGHRGVGVMIERRTILGIEFERISSVEDYAAWIAANGWKSVEAFEGDSFLGFDQLKGRWIFVNRSEGRAHVYARSILGGVRELLCDKQPALQRR